MSNPVFVQLTTKTGSVIYINMSLVESIEQGVNETTLNMSGGEDPSWFVVQESAHDILHCLETEDLSWAR